MFSKGPFVAYGALKMNLTHIFIMARNSRGERCLRWRKCHAVICVITCISALTTGSCIQRISSLDALLNLFPQETGILFEVRLKEFGATQFITCVFLNSIFFGLRSFMSKHVGHQKEEKKLCLNWVVVHCNNVCPVRRFVVFVLKKQADEI